MPGSTVTNQSISISILYHVPVRVDSWQSAFFGIWKWIWAHFLSKLQGVTTDSYQLPAMSISLELGSWLVLYMGESLGLETVLIASLAESLGCFLFNENGGQKQGFKIWRTPKISSCTKYLTSSTQILVEMRRSKAQCHLSLPRGSDQDGRRSRKHCTGKVYVLNPWSFCWKEDERWTSSNVMKRCGVQVDGKLAFKDTTSEQETMYCRVIAL